MVESGMREERQERIVHHTPSLFLAPNLTFAFRESSSTR